MRIAGYKQRKKKKKTGIVRITGIKKSVLKMIMGAARKSYPHEFVGVLRANDGEIIDELALLPGSLQGEVSAIFHPEMLPIEFVTAGSVHSHPSGSCSPSDADLTLFEKFGRVHIIACYPFIANSWKAYNHKGEEIHLDVVDD